MGSSAPFTAVLAAGLLLAACPATAEILKLDCAIAVEIDNVGEGRDGRDSGASRGEWRVQLFLPPDMPELASAEFRNTAPFGLSRFGPGTDLVFNYLESVDSDPLITENQIEWCPDSRGCDVETRLFDRGSWYRVSKAVLDRRRATVSVTVKKYNSLADLRMNYTYHGACAPEPEAQF